MWRERQPFCTSSICCSPDTTSVTPFSSYIVFIGHEIASKRSSNEQNSHFGVQKFVPKRRLNSPIIYLNYDKPNWAAILEKIQPEMAPFDPPSSKTPP